MASLTRAWRSADKGNILECGIDDAGGISRARLHVQLGAKLDELADNRRHQRHAPFVRMGFLQNGDVDVHETLQLCWADHWAGVSATDEEFQASGTPHRLFAARTSP